MIYLYTFTSFVGSVSWMKNSMRILIRSCTIIPPYIWCKCICYVMRYIVIWYKLLSPLSIIRSLHFYLRGITLAFRKSCCLFSFIHPFYFFVPSSLPLVLSLLIFVLTVLSFVQSIQPFVISIPLFVHLSYSYCSSNFITCHFSIHLHTPCSPPPFFACVTRRRRRRIEFNLPLLLSLILLLTYIVTIFFTMGSIFFGRVCHCLFSMSLLFHWRRSRRERLR